MSVPVGRQPRFVKRVSTLTNIRSQEGGFSVQFLWVDTDILSSPITDTRRRVGGGGGGVAVLDWSAQINYIEPVTHCPSY